MSKRKLTRRQAWRIEKIQSERAERAARRDAQVDDKLSDDSLGPEEFGLVVAHYGKRIMVEAIADEADAGHTDGEVVSCHFRANLGSLVTGDRVIWRRGKDAGVIVAVQPRHSHLQRPDPYGDMKTVAANIDRIIIVSAPYPEPHANLIDRYLVATEALDITPLVLFNKADRIDDNNRAKIDRLRDRYEQLGYEVLTVSTRTGENIEALKGFLANYTSVFVGQSGVGKSSLINALLPGYEIKVGELSEATQKGTHTTTTAHLYHFPSGGHLIDSPGIREFGLWHMAPEQVLEGFIEIRPHLGHCKFRDCRHQSEPGCALHRAIDAGDISQSRYDSCQMILESLTPNR
ncbi:small ribosomal subunit biogenesis GTPase RsgA [Simiduia agarivorans]|uniref:Small ribosomal subunit biogenesis GTPase RsgA n=1 Tax=Simiduia agarivorans (strain DSM 21679 / JCM 13881 / BCRC 17597 / SA1) TaxID=1117647 RepID=K4KM44_SIMAS|nr:small ribosomal subunit biogenesis GTPase RsgA [Simiduia agarivorans]AFV00102.1 GTPase RsgA [Simiduia agarivorans SA1 = DSM 21679]